MALDPSIITTAVASTAAGGVSVGWVAKTLIAAYLRKNDEQHGLWRNSIGSLKEVIDEQKTAIAVMNTKLDYLGGIKQEVEDLKRECVSLHKAGA